MGAVSGPVINRGEVWWAVATRQRFTGRLTSLLVVPVTTTVRDTLTEVALDRDDGLPRECAANFDNVFTLRRARISRLADERLAEVSRAYRFAAGC